MANEEMLTKLKKLLALAANAGSEQEAETAMRMASKIMAKYGLESVSLEEEKSGPFIDSFSSETWIDSNSEWEGTLSVIVVECFNCRQIRQKPIQKYGIKGKIIFVGEKKDLVLVEWYYKYLKLAISRRAEQHSKKKRDQHAFAIGMILSLRERLQKLHKYVEEERTEDTTAIVLRTQAMVDKKFREMFPRVKEVNGRKISNQDALKKGQAAGAKLSLSKPINGSNERKSNGPLSLS